MIMHCSLVWLRLVGLGLLIDTGEGAGAASLPLLTAPLSKFVLRMISRLSHVRSIMLPAVSKFKKNYLKNRYL